jgi:glucoamylase
LCEGVPAFVIVNSCRSGRYRIEKQVLTDPKRDTLLQRVRFWNQLGALSDYRLYVLLRPRLGDQGRDNTAWLGELHGVPLIFATHGSEALALACSARFLRRSVGYVGSSDGSRDLKANGRLTREYTRAESGNVALTAEIDLSDLQGDAVLALGFGATPEVAAEQALGSLNEGFESALREYIAGWRQWQNGSLRAEASLSRNGDLGRVSRVVLQCHESKAKPGAVVASLSIPWGGARGDADVGGYHLVWPRDLVQAGGAWLAVDDDEAARRVLSYLRSTQQPDGHWPQNLWIDGRPHSNGIQIDETALPILLVDLAYREGALSGAQLAECWPMVHRAARYLVQNGPVSPMDRWEEDPGYSPYTVAAEIAALLAAADHANLNQEPAQANFLRETADVWHASIDRWMYASKNAWCKRFGVEGYYVRLSDGASGDNRVQLKNTGATEIDLLAAHLVSPDAFALVRFGSRAADDPRMIDTAKLIDELLKIETPNGPTWHRYNQDRYGEHADGSPFDGTGIGRGWPLLSAERAHFELAAGHVSSAKRLIAAVESFANETGLIPEQVWDSADVPEHRLYSGRPSGSAMPLVWAHAEYLKLRRSLNDGGVFDLPPQPVRRYLQHQAEIRRRSWRFNHKLRAVPPATELRIETLAPALVHWTHDDWKTCREVTTQDSGLGVHFADLETLGADVRAIRFTFYWPDAGHWENQDFVVSVETEAAR